MREDGTVYVGPQNQPPTPHQATHHPPQHLDEKASLHLPVDTTTGCLSALTTLRRTTHPHLKLVLSIGGGSGSTPFPTIAASPALRDRLALSLRALVDQIGFDGIDLDWEHPTTPTDGANYLHLLAALRTHLPRPDYLLTSALPTGAYCLRHLDLAAVGEVLDGLNLMCYDFAGAWTLRTGHHAQLYSAAEGERSCHGAVTYLLEQGVPARKIVLGVPVYGRSFAGAQGAGEEFSGEEVCEYRELPGEGAVEWVDEGVGAAGCTHEGGWVSYDVPATVAAKGRYVRERGLGGLFYWTGVGDKEGEGSLVESGGRALCGE